MRRGSEKDVDRVVRLFGPGLRRVAASVRRIRGIERTPNQIAWFMVGHWPENVDFSLRAAGEELRLMAGDRIRAQAFADMLRDPEIEDGVAEALGED